MKGADIVVGETYLFVATMSEARKHLEGEHFTVTEIKKVWRKMGYSRGKKSMKVNRYFNEDGVGARADELEPLDGTPGNEPPPQNTGPAPLWEGDEMPF